MKPAEYTNDKKMRIKKLIEALQKLPPEAEIIIDATPEAEADMIVLDIKEIYECAPDLYFIFIG